MADAYAENYTYNTQGGVLAKGFGMTRAWPISSASLSFTAAYTYDSEGRVLTVAYPPLNNCNIVTQNCANIAGPQYAYTFDPMGRPSTLTRTDVSPNLDIIGSADLPGQNTTTYNLNNQLTHVSYTQINGGGETRVYNGTFQLYQVLTPLSMLVQYNYIGTFNNGQVTNSIDASGRSIKYGYDTLNRLVSAVATDNSWGDNYSHDGFGNLTAMTPPNGVPGTTLTQPVNLATNRLYGSSYDANGNQTTIHIVGQTGQAGASYDIENRLTKVAMDTVIGQYAYNHLNQRVWRLGTENGQTTEELEFYGVDGQRLTSYKLTAGAPNQGNGNLATLAAAAEDMLIYFGHKLVQRGSLSGGALSAGYIHQDQVGSVLSDGGLNGGPAEFDPWGAEMGAVTPNDRTKFATYRRDGETGIDYAMNRNYSSFMGRFLTPDPYRNSAGAEDPGSWNRYSYSSNNPVNRHDPLGMEDCGPSEEDDVSGMTAASGEGLAAAVPTGAPARRSRGAGARPPRSLNVSAGGSRVRLARSGAA